MRALLLFCFAYPNFAHSTPITCLRRVVEQTFRQRLLTAAVEAFATVPQEDFAPMLFVATEAVEEIQRLGPEGFVQQMRGWDLKVTEEEIRWLEQIMNASHRHANVAAFGVSYPQPQDSKARTIPDSSLERLVGFVLSVPLVLPHAINEFLRGRENLFYAYPAKVAAIAALSEAQKADLLAHVLLQLNGLFGSNPQLLGELTTGLTTIRDAMRTKEFRAAMIPYQQSVHRGRNLIEVSNHLHDGWNIVQGKVGARPGDATMLRALMDSVEGLGLYTVPTTRPSFIEETAQK